MLGNKSKSILSVTVTLMLALATFLPVTAQDAGLRYLPDGRSVARAVGGTLGEGLYEVRTYDPAPEVAEFSGATIFYPLTLSFADPIGAVAFMPGYRGTQATYDWWGPALASMGYAVMIMDTNDPEDSLAARKDALIAAVDFLRSENDSGDSPLQGKIDTAKIAIMGHSLGGGGALVAAMELGGDIGAVISLLPYCCELGESFAGDYSDLSVPALIIASAEDTVAPPERHAMALYQSIGDAADKAYIEFASGTHGLATNNGSDLENMALLATAWLKLQLDEQQQFRSYVDAEADAERADIFSRLEASSQ